MQNFILIGIFLSAGALAKHKGWLTSNTSIRLNQFVIFICLPSIILLKIPQLSIDEKLLLPTLVPWGGLVFISLIVLLMAKALNWSREITGCLLMITCFGNTSFFGFPMVRAFWGEEGLPYAVIYDVLGSFLSLALVGNIFIAIYSGGEQFSWLSALKRLITFPPFIAIVVAFGFGEIKYFDWIVTGLTLIGDLLIPSTMFLVGMHLSLKIDKKLLRPLQYALGLKLLLLPLIALLSLELLVSIDVKNSLIYNVTLFEAAMPPMVTASVMAIHARLAPQLAAACVGIGLFLSCITLPLWYLFLSGTNF